MMIMRVGWGFSPLRAAKGHKSSLSCFIARPRLPFPSNFWFSSSPLASLHFLGAGCHSAWPTSETDRTICMCPRKVFPAEMFQLIFRCVRIMLHSLIRPYYLRLGEVCCLLRPVSSSSSSHTHALTHRRSIPFTLNSHLRSNQRLTICIYRTTRRIDEIYILFIFN